MRKSRTILIVEDHQDTRELYACCLSLEGFAVRSASDGVEGIAGVRAQRPHLVILDFSMPRMSGAGVLRQMRMDSDLKLTPVVLVSAQMREFIAAVHGLPFDAALEKPCDLSDLVRVVHAALRAPGGSRSPATTSRATIDAGPGDARGAAPPTGESGQVSGLHSGDSAERVAVASRA